MTNLWQPDVTVASICERDDRYLIVEEVAKSTQQIVLNQPAGHLEDGESIIDAVIRETLEETQHNFKPKALVGLYRLRTNLGKTYIRYTFCGEVGELDMNSKRDPDILKVHWMTFEEVQNAPNLRSNLVLSCIEDYRAGKRYPLDILCEEQL